jgi:restriction endonuclease S subunit
VPKYIAYYLSVHQNYLLPLVRKHGATVHSINTPELLRLEIPLPPLDIQRRLVAELDAARAERDRALAEAERLIATLDDYLLNELGLALPDENSQKAFAVRLGAIRGSRIDPPSYQPILARGVAPKVPIKTLSELAVVNGNSIEKPDDAETFVPYVGLPECNQTEVREVVVRPYREVKGRSVIRTGDILFARIEPSIFNMKYVLVDDLKGHEYAYTSTEFYVVNHRPGISVTEYLYAMFFCSFVYLQSKGKTTGSSGRRRLDPEHFRSLKIPAPDLAVQQTIASEAIRRRNEARRLHSYAKTVWREARERFEQQLLQGDKV